MSACSHTTTRTGPVLHECYRAGPHFKCDVLQDISFSIDHCSFSECISTRRRILCSCFLASAVKTTINKPEKLFPFSQLVWGERGRVSTVTASHAWQEEAPAPAEVGSPSLCSKRCLSDAPLWPGGDTGGQHGHFAGAPGDVTVTDPPHLSGTERQTAPRGPSDPSVPETGHAPHACDRKDAQIATAASGLQGGRTSSEEEEEDARQPGPGPKTTMALPSSVRKDSGGCSSGGRAGEGARGDLGRRPYSSRRAAPL